MPAPSPVVRFIAAVTVAVLASARLAAAPPAAAEPAGAAGMHTFESLALSPDGARIASVEIERSFDSPAELHGPIVVRASADGRVLARLDPCASCRYAGLSWSPDGRDLAFISTDPVKGEAQLTVSRGPHLVVLARIQGIAQSPRFSPDGHALAILATVAARKRTGALEAGAPLTGEIGVEFDEQRIAIVPAAGGELHFASPADTFVYEYDWMPDGHGFVGTAAKGDGDANWWVAELDAFEVAGGSHRIASFELQMSVPRIAPDGRTVRFIGGLMSDFGAVGGEIYEVPIAGGKPVSLTPGFRGSFTSITWRGSQCLATAIVIDRATLLALRDGGRTPQTLWSAPVTARAGEADTGVEVALSADGRTLAAAVEDFAHGPEILAGPFARPRALTHENTSRAAALEVRSLHWRNEGLDVQGWLVAPATGRAAERHPLIVHVHGGPSAAVLPMFGTDYSLYTSVHEWVARGYAVLLPNPRGSFGQGAAFTRANVRDFGGGDFRDILAGVDAALASAPLDPGRLGIHGHSYGGFMAMWAVTHTTRFAAAIAGAGLSDWISYYGTNGIDTWMLPFFGASMYEDPSAYRAVSPLESIRAARTPTLLYTGDSDVEVPASQSFEFWHALRTLGVATELHVYPGEGHLLRDPTHVLDLRQRLPAWFDRYLMSAR
jgi:dipeptidyl aminopeptidase/acylaminoacyl peptidase